MIDVTDIFKSNLHGPKTWRVQISSVDSTWGSMTWQDCPVGAEVVKPLGSIQQMTEDPQPFSFVGPDMQITARNVDGFWTNAGQTGRLDDGTTVYMRVQTGIAADTGNYITMVQGPIDLATISKQPGDMVSFTVRGILNALDYQLATEYCANRRFAATGTINGTYTVTAGTPVKFCDMLTIWPGAGPNGCYKLFYDSKNKTLSFDNGPARGILPMDGQSFLLFGETEGTGIYVMWTANGSRQFTALPASDVEAWIVMRRTINPSTNTDALYLYDCSPISTLAVFKAKLADLVDLDISSIPNLTLATPDPSIYQHVNSDGSDYYPAAIVGIGERTWLMSSWAGTYKGIWKVMISEDPMSIVSFVKVSDSVACYMKLIGTNVVCLLDTSTNKDVFTYKSFGTDFQVGVLALGTMAMTVTDPFGAGVIAWKSFDALDASNAYAVLVTSGTSGKINLVDISGETVSVLGNAFSINGPSMIPGCIVTSPAESYYVCISASYAADDSISYYAQGWHIGSSAGSSVALEVSYAPEEMIGPVGVSSAYTQAIVQGVVENPSGVIVLFDKLAHSNVDFTATKHTAAGGDVWVFNFSTNDTTLVWGEVNAWMVNDGHKDVFYCPVIWTSQVGKTLQFTSGSNIGESQTITAHEYATITPPSCAPIYVSKISFGVSFTNNIVNGDDFKIYETGVTLGDVVSTRVDELKGTTYLHNEIGHVDGAYYEPSSYMVFNNTYLRKEVVGTALLKSLYAWEFWGWKKKKMLDIYGPAYGMIPHAWKKELSGSMLAQVATSDRPWGAGKDTDNRVMIAGRYMLTFINTSGTSQTRQVSANEFGNKSVREAIEEVATACNAYIFPSEHNKRLTLWYRGTAPEQVGGITRDKYHYDGEWIPRLPVDLLTLDGERRGNLVADKFGQDISITSLQTHPSNRKSLANEIWTYLSLSRRWHKVIGDWLIWHEPGDGVPLQISSDTSKDCMVVSTETDPENLTHTMTLLENVA